MWSVFLGAAGRAGAKGAGRQDSCVTRADAWRWQLPHRALGLCKLWRVRRGCCHCSLCQSCRPTAFSAALPGCSTCCRRRERAIGFGLQQPAQTTHTRASIRYQAWGDCELAILGILSLPRWRGINSVGSLTADCWLSVRPIPDRRGSAGFIVRAVSRHFWRVTSRTGHFTYRAPDRDLSTLRRERQASFKRLSCYNQRRPARALLLFSCAHRAAPFRPSSSRTSTTTGRHAYHNGRDALPRDAQRLGGAAGPAVGGRPLQPGRGEQDAEQASGGRAAGPERWQERARVQQLCRYARRGSRLEETLADSC